MFQRCDLSFLFLPNFTTFAHPGSDCSRKRRANFYQNFVVLRNRLFNLPDLENVRGPVSAVDGGFHVRMDAHDSFACSFHRCVLTPITRSQTISTNSPMPQRTRT